MTDHLPVLQVVIPLIAAALCALAPRGRIAWGIALATSWITLWIAIQLLARVQAEGPISYALGGWLAPEGIEYRIDLVSAFVVVIVTAIGAVVTPYALKSIEREIDAAKIPLFYAAFLLCLTGLLGIAVTGDVFNVFVFLEISSLSAYALIALGQDRRALTAAYQYLIMGSIGATFIVIGIAMMYVMTGTLNMADLSVLLSELGPNRTIAVAFGFLTVGISLKLALFPLHLWLPNAYTYAPSAVTAFIASTATKVAVYMLLRFFFTIFGGVFSFDVMQLDRVLLPLALIAIFTMSLVAIFQTNVKRMLAYSSVAQIGYMILGISLASVTGLTAGILHLFNHALIKGSLFMAMGCVMYRVGSVEIDAMRGLAKKMPWTMAAFVAGGISLIGVPLTVGFISKWYLILGALERGSWWWTMAALVLTTSLMAVIYVWRVVEAAYFQEAPGEGAAPAGSVAAESAGVESGGGRGTPIVEAPLALLIPTWALIIANFYFGIDATFTREVAGSAARALMGIAP